MPLQHIPVLLNEVIEYLQPKSGQNFIDCTLGGGGHAKEIIKKISPDGRLLAIDLDETAIALAKDNLSSYNDRIEYVLDNFSKIKQIHNERFSLFKINAILLDLGLSSIGLKDKDRGFSFQVDGPLDMRFDKRQSLTAEEIVNTWSFDKLNKVIREYGQEKLAPEVTNAICDLRQRHKITKTKMLVGAILLAFRNKLKTNKEVPWIGGIHPATRTFQALRIAVNDELNVLRKTLPQCLEVLDKGGRLAVISFHSLEDRIVKRYFRQESKNCICPVELPICQCDHKAILKIITKKPITASDKEIDSNSRSRSAKMRVAEKI